MALDFQEAVKPGPKLPLQQLFGSYKFNIALYNIQICIPWFLGGRIMGLRRDDGFFPYFSLSLE